MKKILGIILVIAMLAGFGALAEGGENLYNGDINFGDFKLGSTFAEVRKSVFLNSINFNTYAMPSRIIGDALGDSLSYSIYGTNSEVAQSFISYPGSSKKVAGYDVSMTLYFTYPIVDGKFQINEADGILIGGRYDFYSESDAKAIFDDLKSKLTSTYGEPWKEATSANDIWGALKIPSGYDWLNEEMANLDPSYVVWKSATNGAEVVLVNCTRYEENRTMVSYIYPAMDEEILAAHSAGTVNVSDSTDGL